MPASLSWTDNLIAIADEALRASTVKQVPDRPSPATSLAQPPLDSGDRKHAAALMRVNHAGEVSAQALYLGQSLWARSPDVRRQLLDTAREERDHLAWCAERVEDLGGQTSRLGPFWFVGSLVIGAAAGVFGDGPSLGFVAETERQVGAHLNDHLGRLPAADTSSAAILRTMAEDEVRHGHNAELAGGTELPSVARAAMRLAGNFLRRVAYFV